MKDTDALVSGYLKRLQDELSDLPRAPRRELVGEISEHIDEARSGREIESEADLRNLLDRLGEPADIAAEARERLGVPPKKSGAGEVGALIMLSIGGVIVPILGWVVGVVLLWVSDMWNKREKLIGTFLVPGGLALPIYLVGFSLRVEEPCVSNRGPGGGIQETCPGGASTLESILWVLLLIVLVVIPLVTTTYLARRMRQRSRTEAGWSTPTADEGYGFMRRVVYFLIAVPVVFGVIWLIIAAADRF